MNGLINIINGFIKLIAYKGSLLFGYREWSFPVITGYHQLSKKANAPLM